jgi:hypothetical protein
MFQYNPLETGSSGQVGAEDGGKAATVHAIRRVVEGGIRRIAPFILNQALDRNEWLSSRPGRFIPGDRVPPYPLNRRLGGPQSRSARFGEVKNVLSFLGIEPRYLECPAGSLMNLLHTKKKLYKNYKK